MRTLRFKSYAKINLFLEVLNKREDGYHQIITLFERISLYDEIAIRPRPDKIIRIICRNRNIPKDKTNLAYRAAALLKDDLGIGQGLEIVIKKNIPVAAGMGGGSSNAASVLLALNQIWRLNLNRDRLLSYGKVLGADVPFFLSDTAFAIGNGRGELIEDLPSVKSRFWHIVLVPRIKASSRAVYDRFDKITTEKKKELAFLSAGSENGLIADYAKDAGLTKARDNVKIFIQILKQAKVPLIRRFLFNRLEMATFDMLPGLRRHRDRLLKFGIEGIRMTGSGPAMFSLVSSRKEAELLCRKLCNFKNMDIFIARTV